MPQIWNYGRAAPIFESEIISTKQYFNIATNQSLNQKVPMFLHRGFVFSAIPL